MNYAEKISVSVKNTEAFEPLIVMEFAANTKQDAIEWVILKLKASCSNNVSKLSVSPMVMQHNQFEFVNCFMSLFYVAFYLQDMRLLRSQRAKQLDIAMKMLDMLQKVELHNAEVAEEIQKQAIVESTMDVYEVAFEVISVLAVVTNCALIGMNPEVSKLLPSNLTPINIVFIFVVIEHLLITIKMAVAYFIPDVPKWIEVELAKIAYQSKLALKKQR